MILISAGLVVTAIVLLIAGFVLAKPFLVMWSIAVSVLSAVFLVIGALLRRHELFPGGRAGAAPLPPKGPVPAGPMPAPHMRPDQRVPSAPHPRAPHGMPPAATAAPQPRPRPVAGPATAARQGLLDAEAIVLVIPGRKRYHVAGCRQLVGRDHEELTHEEAREEGFTPCTTCLPEFTGGIQPQDAPTGAQEPAAHLAPSPEPGTSGDTRGPDVHEPTARFSPPYRPVTTATPQEAAAQVTRPYIQGAPAPQEQERPQEPASPPLRAAETTARSFPIQSPEPEPETSADSEATSWFSRDMVASAASKPEAQAGTEPATPEDGAPAAPEPVTPASKPEAQAGTEPAEAENGAPAEPEPVMSASTGAEAPAEAGGSAEPDPAAAKTSIIPSRSLPSGGSTPSEPEDSADAGSESRGGVPAGSRPAGAGTPVTAPAPAGAGHPVRDETPAASSVSDPETPASSETSDPETSASPEPSGAEGAAGSGSPATSRPATSSPAALEAPEAPSPAERKATDGSASAEPHSPSEPVEPADTAPGRAGQPVPADSTSAESQVPAAGEKAGEEAAETERKPAPEETSGEDDGDTAPHGIPAVKDGPEPGSGDSGTVKVIVGTRRFHSSACPLIKGTDGSGIETMTRAEAEEAGLSSCSVCRDQG
ncbi:hypothetical protein [Streptosporangium canum]|uniref:hypothetical protein n=1 Tax=Streptosporangium canum TaxID=324952 RepID=UPI00379C2043